MSLPLAYRPLAWAVRKSGAQSILALGLLLAVLESLAYALGASLRGLENAWLWVSAILGLLVGWGLASSRLSGWRTAPLALLSGFAFTLFHLAGLAGPLFRTIFGISEKAWVLIRWPYVREVDFRPLAPVLIELWTKISVPVLRLVGWLEALLAGRPAFDPAAVTLLWNLAVWSVAAWAAWWFRRRSQPLLAILPAGSLLAAILSYQRESALPLLPVVAAALSLTALVGFRERQRGWESDDVDTYDDAPFEIGLAAAVLVLVAGTAFFMAPPLSLQRLLEFSRGLPVADTGGTGQAVQSLGLKPRVVQPSPFAGIWSPGLPREHMLGSGPELSRQPVMQAWVELESQPEDGLPVEARLYWRGRNYDMYTGRGWSTSGFFSKSYSAGENLFDPQGMPGFLVSQKVQMISSSPADEGTMLFTAGAPLSADRPLRAGWRAQQDLFAALLEYTSPAFMPNYNNPTYMPAYTAQSWVTLASQEQLRAAGQDYPDWVRGKYFQLPDSLPARVLGLGRDLTAAEATPYDRALAIEAYLRTFPYTLDLQAPPPGRDVSDYFLFDIKRGYCDYYATAMVVLARAAGLPARLVVGYASGEYDPQEGLYQVTAADAHSWPEVYFPGIGWVEFEPTGGRPPLRRPETTPIPNLQPGVDQAPAPTTSPRPGLGSLITVLAGLAGFALIILLARSGVDAWRLQRLPPRSALAILYRRLSQVGIEIGAKIRPVDTPYEVAARIQDQVDKLNKDSVSIQPLNHMKTGVGWLAERFALSAYSPHQPTESDRTQGLRTWRALRRELWFAQLRRILRRSW